MIWAVFAKCDSELNHTGVAYLAQPSVCRLALSQA